MIVIVNLIYVLFSFSIGLFLIVFAWNPSMVMIYLKYGLSHFYSQVSEPLRLQVGLGGFLIILVCLKYLEMVVFRSRREKPVVLESPEGKISITLYAIEDMLKKILRNKKELSDVRPKVIAGKKIIEILIRCNLTAEVNLQEFKRETQEELREKIQNLLGEDKEIKVKIEIRKMATADNKKKVVVEEEPEIPFRNY
jgi:hypothetical protein